VNTNINTPTIKEPAPTYWKSSVRGGHSLQNIAPFSCDVVIEVTSYAVAHELARAFADTLKSGTAEEKNAALREATYTVARRACIDVVSENYRAFVSDPPTVANVQKPEGQPNAKSAFDQCKAWLTDIAV
jgi:hypothetical protein